MLTKHKIQTPTDTNETLLKLETGNTICPPAILSECFSAVITVLKQLPSVAGEGEGGVNKHHIKTLYTVQAATMEGNH